MKPRSMRTSDSPAQQLARCIAKYDAAIGTLARAARAKLRKRWPTAVELVYDNYNALVIGFGPSDRASQAIVSLALYPRWVTLFFLRGAELEDRDGLLRGSGRQVRSIVLNRRATSTSRRCRGSCCRMPARRGADAILRPQAPGDQVGRGEAAPAAAAPMTVRDRRDGCGSSLVARVD
ncbi:MAG: hypothetical protein U1E76_26860 [Planctomycetota bacterium]